VATVLHAGPGKVSEIWMYCMYPIYMIFVSEYGIVYSLHMQPSLQWACTLTDGGALQSLKGPHVGSGTLHATLDQVSDLWSS
jgi:hypothetical protein